MNKLQDCVLADSWLNKLCILGEDLLIWKDSYNSAFLFVCISALISYPCVCIVNVLLLAVLFPVRVLHVASYIFPEWNEGRGYLHLQKTLTLDIVASMVRWVRAWKTREASRRLCYRITFFQVQALALAILICTVRISELLEIMLILLMVAGSPPLGVVLLYYLSVFVNIFHCALIIGNYLNSDQSTEGIDSLRWISIKFLEWKVSIYENQRWWAGIGWTSELLQQDPGPWSSQDGTFGIKSPDFYEPLGRFGKTTGWVMGIMLAKMH